MKMTCFAIGLFVASAVSAQQQRFDDVVRNLRNPDPKVRLSAVRLLRDAKYPESIAPMAPLVLDPIDDVQLEAIAAELSFFLEQDVKTTKRVGFVIEKRKSAIAAAAFDLGPLAVWPRPALAALAQIGAPGSVPLFRERLQDKDPYIRRAATEGLGRAGDVESIDTLEKTVTTDDSPMVRLAAAFALHKLGRNYAARLVDLMSSPKVLTQGQEYLIELGPSIAPTVAPRIQEPNPDVREALIDVLGVIGNESTLPLLQAATTDADASVVAAAKRATARLQAPK